MIRNKFGSLSLHPKCRDNDPDSTKEEKSKNHMRNQLNLLSVDQDHSNIDLAKEKELGPDQKSIELTFCRAEPFQY